MKPQIVRRRDSPRVKHLAAGDCVDLYAAIELLQQRLQALELEVSTLKKLVVETPEQSLHSPQSKLAELSASVRGKLTVREAEILRLYARTPNDQQIAQASGARVQTVRNHLASIKRKLGLRSREEMLLLCWSSVPDKDLSHG